MAPHRNVSDIRKQLAAVALARCSGARRFCWIVGYPVDRSQFVIMNTKLLLFLVVASCVLFTDARSISRQNADAVEGNLRKGVQNDADRGEYPAKKGKPLMTFNVD